MGYQLRAHFAKVFIIVKTFYTYLYIDPKNSNPIYIGKGQDKRAWDHFTKTSNPRLTYTLTKRIKEGYIIEPILTYWPSEAAAYAGEIFWIATYGRDDLGKGTLFNRTDGGDAPPSAKGRKRSQEWKDKHKVPCKEETKKKIGDANRDRKLRPSWNKDLNITEEHKRRISESKKGSIPWNKNKGMSEETKRKISESQKARLSKLRKQKIKDD